jgi:dihydroflavonol-4-reductase|tara:strand:+ start:273 stop:1256 length:984 start_codon:yes stop_codon:yes gene_type:complete
MPKKIFITGATGFIGSNLVKKLYNGKDKIISFSKIPDHPFLEGLKIKKIVGDIGNYNALLKAMRGSDYVYHLAACSLGGLEHKKELFDVNIKGTENVMKACLKNKVKKVMNTSSCAVLGFTNSPKIKLTEKNNLIFKDNFYGQSKKLGEDIVKKYVARGLDATIVNPGSVFGAGEVEPLGLIGSIKRGRIKFAFPGGTTLVSVSDIVDGMVLAMKKGKKGERYILANEYMSFKEMYNTIANILNKPRIRFELPLVTYYPMYLLGAIMQRLIKGSFISTETARFAYHYRNWDSTKARKELGWIPKVTYKEAVRQALAYYQKYNKKWRS